MRKGKTIRVTLQLLVLAAIVFWIVHITTERGKPQPPKRDEWMQRNGFVALSYGAISREQDGPNLPRGLLRTQLATLADGGYQIIDSADIDAFYRKGEPLPDKALFLMFEGGRKDSAIFGQEALLQTGMKATMYIQTGLIDSWDKTFLSRSQITALGNSSYWDVGTSGHQLYLPETMNQDRPGYFLANLKRDADGNVIEGLDQFAARAEKDIEESRALLHRLLDEYPESFVFMPANTLGGSLHPDLTAINKDLIERYFTTAFIREGNPFNSFRQRATELGRLRVTTDMDPASLLAELDSWQPGFLPYLLEDDSLRVRWQVDRGAMEWSEEGGMVLIADEPGSELVGGEIVDWDGEGMELIAREAEAGAFAWLRGSEQWRNLSIKAQMSLRNVEEVVFYLRFISRESFLRLRLSPSRMIIQERVAGGGLTTLLDRDLPESSEIEFDATLRNRRFWLSVNGVQAVDLPLPVAEPIAAGRMAIEITPREGGSKDPVGERSIRFYEITINPVDERWLSAETTPDQDDAQSVGYTAVLLPFENAGDYDARLAQQLLRGAGYGMKYYAVLETGVLDPGDMSVADADLPEPVRSHLWAGVVITPGPRQSWDSIAKAAETIRQSGLSPVVRLTPRQAETLARRENRLPVDSVLIQEGELPRRVEAILVRRYPLVLHENAAESYYGKG